MRRSKHPEGVYVLSPGRDPKVYWGHYIGGPMDGQFRKSYFVRELVSDSVLVKPNEHLKADRPPAKLLGTYVPNAETGDYHWMRAPELVA